MNKIIKNIKGIHHVKELAKGVVALALMFTSVDIHIDGCGVRISVSIARRGGMAANEEPNKEPA